MVLGNEVLHRGRQEQRLIDLRGMSCSCAHTESDTPFFRQQNPPITRTGS
jgi:hypothetical protein